MLVDTTPRKPRGIIQRFEEALDLAIAYAIKVPKPNDESLSTEWEYVCPAARNVSWKSVKEYIENIVTFIQQLSMAQELHSEDIKLL